MPYNSIQEFGINIDKTPWKYKQHTNWTILQGRGSETFYLPIAKK